MSNHSWHFKQQQAQLFWVDTLKDVACHFKKIGEAIERCASATENLLQSHDDSSMHETYSKCSRCPSHMCPTKTSALHPGTQHRVPTNSHIPDHAHHPTTSSCLNHIHHRQNSTLQTSTHPSHRPTIHSHSELSRHHVQRTVDQALQLKRQAQISLSELEQKGRQPLRVMSMPHNENIRSSINPRGPRPNKRIRINWSNEENEVFFKVIRKHASADETTVLREIASTLDGSRTWIQCKGHFRNLFAVGRITRPNDPSGLWRVHEEEVMDNKQKVSSPSSFQSAEKEPPNTSNSSKAPSITPHKSPTERVKVANLSSSERPSPGKSFKPNGSIEQIIHSSPVNSNERNTVNDATEKKRLPCSLRPSSGKSSKSNGSIEHVRHSSPVNGNERNIVDEVTEKKKLLCSVLPSTGKSSKSNGSIEHIINSSPVNGNERNIANEATEKKRLSCSVRPSPRKNSKSNDFIERIINSSPVIGKERYIANKATEKKIAPSSVRRSSVRSFKSNGCIDRIINPSAVNGDSHSTESIGKTTRSFSDDKGRSEQLENSTKKQHERNDAPPRNFRQLSRDALVEGTLQVRETAMFLSSQAAAKEAFEKSLARKNSKAGGSTNGKQLGK